MQQYQSKRRNKYLFLEISFFIIYFIGIPVLSGIELHLYENYPYLKKEGIFHDSFEQFISGCFMGIAYGTLYYVSKKFLFRQKTWIILLIITIFCYSLTYYIKAEDYIISQISLFPVKMRGDAARRIHYKNNFTYSYLIVEVMALASLAYFIRFSEQEEEVKQLREQHLLAELNYLKAQMQPHLFFNTLNNIYALALKQSKDTAPLISRLAAMMRYILYETEQEKVLLKGEIDFLSNYVEVEKIRHPKKIRIDFDVQGIQDQHLVEPLLLLPFIENAFKHGIEEETGSGFVNVVLCVNERELTLQVDNSKPESQKDHLPGIGLKNVIKRLDLLYPGRYLLNIDENDRQYHLALSLQTV